MIVFLRQIFIGSLASLLMGYSAFSGNACSSAPVSFDDAIRSQGGFESHESNESHDAYIRRGDIVSIWTVHYIGTAWYDRIGFVDSDAIYHYAQPLNHDGYFSSSKKGYYLKKDVRLGLPTVEKDGFRAGLRVFGEARNGEVLSGRVRSVFNNNTALVKWEASNSEEITPTYSTWPLSGLTILSESYEATAELVESDTQYIVPSAPYKK